MPNPLQSTEHSEEGLKLQTIRIGVSDMGKITPLSNSKPRQSYGIHLEREDTRRALKGGIEK